MADKTATDLTYRRFKKKTAPVYIKPDNVMPCGVLGTTGVTLKRIAFSGIGKKPNLQVVQSAAR